MRDGSAWGSDKKHFHINLLRVSHFEIKSMLAIYAAYVFDRYKLPMNVQKRLNLDRFTSRNTFFSSRKKCFWIFFVVTLFYLIL